jgi:hypothetical protein
MPAWLEFLLYLAALLCFLLAAYGVAVKRANLVPLGLALWVFVLVVHAFDRMT